MAKIANTTISDTVNTWRTRSNESFDRLSQFAVNNSSLYANTVTANTSFTSKGTSNLGDSTSDLTTIAGRATVGTNLTVSGNTSISGTTDASALGTASVVLAGGLSVAKKMYIGDNIVMAGGKTVGWSDTAFSRATTNTTQLGNGTAGDATGVLLLTKIGFYPNYWANITNATADTIQIGAGSTTGYGGSLYLTNLTAYGTTDATAIGTASVVLAGGLSVAAKIIASGTITSVSGVIVQSTGDMFLSTISTGTIQSAGVRLVGRQSSVDSEWNIVAAGSGLTTEALRFVPGGWTGSPAFTLNGQTLSTGKATVSYTTASTSTTSGALVVSGGVGVAGNLHVGGGEIRTTVGSYPKVVWNSTSNSTDLKKFQAYIEPTTGDLHFTTLNDAENAAAQAWYFKRTGQLSIPITTASTSTTTGALVVAGGLGVAGDVYIAAGKKYGFTSSNYYRYICDNAYGDYVSIVQNAYATGIAFGFDAGAGVGTPTLKLIPSGTTNNAGQVQVPATTASTSTTTGALVVSGGLGVAGVTHVGGYLTLTLQTQQSNFTMYCRSNQGGTLNFVDANTNGQSWQIGPGAGSGSPDYFAFYNNTTAAIIYELSKTGVVNVKSNATAASTSTAALVVTGGVGIGDNLRVANKGWLGQLNVGADAQGTTNANGYNVDVNADSNNYHDHKTKNNGHAVFRCGHNTEPGYQRAWMQVTASSGAIRINQYGAGTLSTDGSGNITASDERLKNIKGDYMGGLAVLRGMKPILFEHKTTPGLLRAGLSAQNVVALIPEARGEIPGGYINFDDRAVLAVHTNAIVEVDDKVEFLTAELTAAKARIEQLEKRMN